MQIALDPFMFGDRPLGELPRLAADLGYEALELSKREDLLPYFGRPRADRSRMAELRRACEATGVPIASIMVLYRWASANESEREAALRYWSRAIEVAVELGCTTINTEFTGRSNDQASSEDAFWRSLEQVLPLLEREGIALHLEPHPDDWVETNTLAVDMIRGIDSPSVKYLYCAPHTFHLGDDVEAMIRYAAPVLGHVHIADTYNHRAGDGFRYILNPFESGTRVHQHNVIGHGEVEWDRLFGTLAAIGFDGLMTSCVLGWNDKAEACHRENRAKIAELVDRHF